MLRISQLLKFVSDLNPQNTPARLSFYNFLRAFGDPESALTPEFIDLFFNYSMDYPHWAGNKAQLGHEVQFMLENFNSLYQEKIALDVIRFPQSLQIIEIEHFNDGLQAVTNHVKSTLGEGDKFRIVPDQNKRYLAILLKKDKSIRVRCFDRKFTIRAGILEPLRKDLELVYTSELELDPQAIQKIEIAPYITAQFQVRDERVHGVLIRGYVFQKLLELKGEKLQDQPRVFFPIKRIEQFFVNRETDPYYQNLVSQLERCRALAQQGDKEALNWSSVLLSQAETALENIFVGDKFLQLLVRDLQNTSNLAKKTNRIVDVNVTGLDSSKFESSRRTEEECLKIAPLIEFDSTN